MLLKNINKIVIANTCDTGSDSNFRIYYSIISYTDDGILTVNVSNGLLPITGSSKFRRRLFSNGIYDGNYIYAITNYIYNDSYVPEIEKWIVSDSGLTLDSHITVTGESTSWSHSTYIKEYNALCVGIPVNQNYDILINAETGSKIWKVSENTSYSLHEALNSHTCNRGGVVFNTTTNKSYYLYSASGLIVVEKDMTTGVRRDISLTPSTTLSGTTYLVSIGTNPYQENSLYGILAYKSGISIDKLYFVTIDLTSNKCTLHNTLSNVYTYVSSDLLWGKIDMCIYKGRFRVVQSQANGNSTSAVSTAFYDMSIPHLEIPITNSLYGISGKQINAYNEGTIYKLSL